MKLIEQTDIFLEKLSEIDLLVETNKSLPHPVLKSQFSKFLVIDFDEVMEDSFFEKINTFARKTGSSKCTFLVLTPDPNKFFDYFKNYPSFEISHEDSYEDYFYITRNEPHPNSDDAILYSMEVAVLYPELRNWVVYADRDFEIGIVGFRETETMESFVSTYGKEHVFNMAEAIPNLLEVMYKDNIVPEDIRNALLANYG